MGSPKSTEVNMLSPVNLPALLSPIRSPVPPHDPYIPMPLYTYTTPKPWPTLPPKPSRHVLPVHLTEDPRLMRQQKIPLHQKLDPRHQARLLLLEPLPIPHNPTTRRKHPTIDPREVALPPQQTPYMMRQNRQEQLEIRALSGTMPYFEKTGKTPKGSRNVPVANIHAPPATQARRLNDRQKSLCLLYTSPSPRD